MKVTLTIKDEVKEQSMKAARDSQIRGGLSGLVELLLVEWLKEQGKK